MSLTTVNGPAPTGASLNAFSPSLLSAVGDTIQLTLASWKVLISGAYGWVRWITTSYEPEVVIEETGHLGVSPTGAARSRLKLNATAAALNGVPSLNVTPCLSSIVTVLSSAEIVYPVARSSIVCPFAPSSNRLP